MTITLKIAGTIENREEKLTCELVLPDNWNPSFEEFCKVRGALRILMEKLAQDYEPKPSQN